MILAKHCNFRPSIPLRFAFEKNHKKASFETNKHNFSCFSPQKVRILGKHNNWYFSHVFEGIFFSYSYPWTKMIVQNFWRWETQKIVFVCFKRRLFVIFLRCKSKWYRRPKIAIFCQNHLVYLKNWWLEDENSNVKWQKPPI